MHNRSKIIEIMTKRTDGKVPIIIGITGKTDQKAVTYVEQAHYYGADAVITIPSFFINRIL